MLVEVYKSVNNTGKKLGWDKFEINQRETGSDDKDDDSQRPPKLKSKNPKSFLHSFHY